MNYIKKNKFLLEEIVKRNFAAKYKDSVLGILWSVLKPLLTMILMTIIFSTIFKGSIENYAVYFLCGRCIYDFFTAGVSGSMNSITGNKSIIMKTSSPKLIFIIGGIISEFMNLIISLIILIGVMIVTKSTFYFETIPYAIIPIISVVLMLSGIGLMLSVACVYYTDIKHLWGVVSLMLMYASALFYPMNIIPEPYHQYIILNPLFWVIDQFRHFVLWGTMPNALNVINSLLLSLIILVFGIIVFKKYEPKVIMKL